LRSSIPSCAGAARATDSDGLRRETPILLQRADGILAEGVVDLAFREETSDFSGWTVVDFKTDGEFEVKNAKYTAQVALYADAIRKATGLPARGSLFIL
jgi:ATP-dependent helicase/nuclease subunit A